jgi:predicted component of type VI protein secretion system
MAQDMAGPIELVRMVTISRPTCRTNGDESSRLSNASTVLGSRTWSRVGRLQLELGPPHKKRRHEHKHEDARRKLPGVLTVEPPP